MSVGEALAEARSRAGLSVDELAERTRIRTGVIRCIEQNDWDACGGDVFVRGYVRALAGAVGIDARPLIREYNRARVESSGEANVTHVARIANQVPPADPAGVGADDGPRPPAVAATAVGPRVADPEVTVTDLPAVPAGPAGPAAPAPARENGAEAAAGTEAAATTEVAANAGAAAGAEVTAADLPFVSADRAARRDGPDVTATDLPFIPEDPAPTVTDLPAIAAEPGPPVLPVPPVPPVQRPQVLNTTTPWAPGSEGVLGSESAPNGDGAEPPGTRSHRRNRRGMAKIALPTALALAAAGVAIGLIVASQSNPPAKNATAFSQHASHATVSPARTPSPAKATPSTAPAVSASPTASPPSSPAPPPVTSLPIANAEAFGPGGLANGDNTQYAQDVIHGGSPWESQWYATAHFGDLKQGTGLLIDMGHSVTITSVQINLAGYGGADLQLRVGDSASSVDGMRVAAQASGVGGTVRLHLSSPATTRYLLIWFTLLPPNGAGQYQASVYHVVVDGYR